MSRHNPWQVSQLTQGSNADQFHSHAYYDIPVFDPEGRRLVGHRVGFAGRHPEPADAIEIGVIDIDSDRRWEPVGSSLAWSWQQGAMSQWLPSGRQLLWNDREGARFVARVLNYETGVQTMLPRPVYAVDPAGSTGLSLNMARLQHLRPGYGYAGGDGALIDAKCPASDGVWALDLESGAERLVLSLADAKRFVMRRLPLRQRLKHAVGGYSYWFNHAKFSPSGTRFTVKLRFRKIGESWNETMGWSLSVPMEGDDLHLIDDATSHVIWLDDEQLYLWRGDGVYLYADTSPRGKCRERIAARLINENVHIRHMPAEPDLFIFDTPYREDIDLLQYDRATDAHQRIARFENHRPAKGPFRCDLHPNPSRDGRRVVVTSMQDGGRQMYLLERD